MFNLWLNLRCAGLKAGVGELTRLPQFEPLVSVSAGAQDVDYLRCCGAYPLIVQHHVQALVVGNGRESGGDNRLLFGALVLEAAALHLKDAALHRGQTTGLLLRFRLILYFYLVLCLRMSPCLCSVVSARSCSVMFPPVCSSPAAVGVAYRKYSSSPSLEEK